MTYKINPVVELIESPVKVLFPDSNMLNYSSGKEVAYAIFDKLYKIRRITADSSNVVLELEETKFEPVEDPFV